MGNAAVPGAGRCVSRRPFLVRESPPGFVQRDTLALLFILTQPAHSIKNGVTMKKTFLVLFGWILLLALSANVHAQSGSGDGYDYIVNPTNSATITITNSTGPGGSVVIPTNINGLAVTAIGTNAFEFKTNLTSVLIPGCVASIANAAFEFCTRLTNVTISDGVVIMGPEVFEYCGGLGNVMLPGSLKSMGDSAFYGCAGLTNMVIPGSVTNLGSAAFYQCTALTSVSIPGSLTTLGSEVFESCPGLTNIVIPASVTHIGFAAFYNSVNLTSIYFTGNSPAVAADAFLSDTSATAYYLPGTTGWSNTFASSPAIPAVLWNPLIQTSDASFGIHNNRFGFNITATNNFTVVVAACTNLANPVWTPLTNVTLTNGSYYFTDPQWATYSRRFYGVGLP